MRKARIGRGNARAAGQREVQRSSKTVTLNRGNGGFGHFLNAPHHGLSEAGKFQRGDATQLRNFVESRSGGESLRRASDYDSGDGIIALRLVQSAAEFPKQIS